MIKCQNWSFLYLKFYPRYLFLVLSNLKKENIKKSLMKKFNSLVNKNMLIIVFSLGIFRKVQPPVRFSPTQNVPNPFFRSWKCTLPISQQLKMHPVCFHTSMCNIWTAHFIVKVKQSYITFIFNLEQCFELPPPHL